MNAFLTHGSQRQPCPAYARTAFKRYQALVVVVCVAVTPVVSRAVPVEPSAQSKRLASSQREPLDPDVKPASGEAQETMSAVRIPEGWTIELVASEPDVANVVAFDVDDRGQIFVCETFRQNQGVTDNRAHDEAWLLADLSSETVQDRIDYHKRLLGDAAITYEQHDDRVRRLRDIDGDGCVDESIVVAKGFNALEEGTGAGVLALGSDIYYTCIPKLWRLTDEDGDGVAERREVLADGFGVRVAFRGHDLHGLIRGPDGRLYFTIGDRGYHVTVPDSENKATDGSDATEGVQPGRRVLSNPAVGAVFRCEMDGSNLEVIANGLRNPQELAFNDLGDLFSVDNNSDSGDKARIVQILPGSDAGWRMHYQYLPDRGPFNRLRIWEPHHEEQPAYILPPIANLTDGPSGLVHYPGTGFGDELTDQFLICDFRGGASNSGIRSFRLVPDGAFHKLAEDAESIWNVLATDLAFAPDGSLLISDWVNGWDGLGKARLYRLSSVNRDGDLVTSTRQILSTQLADHSNSDLARHLIHPDRRVRLRAQWALAERGPSAAREVTQALHEVASDVELASKFRLHGIWGITHAARLDSNLADAAIELGQKLAKDSDPVVVSAALQLLGEIASDSGSAKLIHSGITHVEPRVQLTALFASTQRKLMAVANTVVEKLAENENQDPAIRHAGTRYLQTVMAEKDLIALKSHPSVAVRRAAVTALRNRASGSIAEFLSDKNQTVTREAALAILDQPIPVAMVELANQITRDDIAVEDKAYLRRVLVANHRVANESAAAALAAFAASDQNPAWSRVMALDLIARWDSDDPRCPVTNRVLPRTVIPSQAMAASAVEARVDELLLAPDSIKERAIDVASSLGITKITPALIERFQDTAIRPEARANALRAIARLAPERGLALANKVPTQSSVELVSASLSVLAALAPMESVDRFVLATKSSQTRLRGLGWDLLSKLDDDKVRARIQAALDDYLRGDLPSDVQLNVLEAAANRLDPEAMKAVTSYRDQLAEKDPLAMWLPSLHGGDASIGEKIFFGKTELSCVRCHRVDRVGGDVGPVLTTIGKQRDRRSLLESICLPDAKIAEGFETAVIADEDGGVYTGIVDLENDELIEIIAADGTRNRIYQDTIIARRKGQSSMPAGLAKLMTRRELRDLVAYLASLQVDSRAATDVE
ncbi:MAG: PQQ-dependent sugar dehydrogenase [Planctomycetota bacterium]